LPLGTTTILVIASDLAFRQSLSFVLEAEGHRVELADQLPAAEKMDGYDCVVIDDRTLHDPTELKMLRWPVVLLVNDLESAAVHDSVRLVQKPLLGRTLVEAVRNALGQG
jgi:DNA-binding NtrC family response regulator